MHSFINKYVLKAVSTHSTAHMLFPPSAVDSQNVRDTGNSKSQWVGADWTAVRGKGGV